MAYNEFLADRIRLVLKDKGSSFQEKKMMGGLAFMVADKMCVGVIRDDLMARIAPEDYDAALTREGCREMNFTGRPMKGFVFVDQQGTDMDENLAAWVQLALDFNPRAKSSKKK